MSTLARPSNSMRTPTLVEVYPRTRILLRKHGQASALRRPPSLQYYGTNSTIVIRSVEDGGDFLTQRNVTRPSTPEIDRRNTQYYPIPNM